MLMMLTLKLFFRLLMVFLFVCESYSKSFPIKWWGKTTIDSDLILQVSPGPIPFPSRKPEPKEKATVTPSQTTISEQNVVSAVDQLSEQQENESVSIKSVATESTVTFTTETVVEEEEIGLTTEKSSYFDKLGNLWDKRKDLEDKLQDNS